MLGKLFKKKQKPTESAFEPEQVPEAIMEYLENKANTINGMMRGAINEKAREYNLATLQMAVSQIFYDGIGEGLRIGNSNKKDNE